MDGNDDSGTDKSRLSPVVHIEGDRVRIGTEPSVEDNSLDSEGVWSEDGRGILAGSNSTPTSLGIWGISSEAAILSLSDLQSSAVMYSVERSDENSDLQSSAVTYSEGANAVVYSESEGMVGNDA